jgi:hypothetical protein
VPKHVVSGGRVVFQPSGIYGGFRRLGTKLYTKERMINSITVSSRGDIEHKQVYWVRERWDGYGILLMGRPGTNEQSITQRSLWEKLKAQCRMPGLLFCGL